MRFGQGRIQLRPCFACETFQTWLSRRALEEAIESHPRHRAPPSLEAVTENSHALFKLSLAESAFRQKLNYCPVTVNLFELLAN